MPEIGLSTEGLTDPGERAAVNHVRRRTIVLPGLQLLFVPVPKAGWTSLLWELAGLAGLSAADFRGSVKPEISTTMMVHDERVWGAHGLRLHDLDDDRHAEALSSPDWLRFTVVRDPAPRLWSAWQSKFLLREPVYRGFHGEQPWYPRRPESPAAVVEDFRRFVVALREGFGEEQRLRDPHWGRQHDVVSLLPVDHVGRLERLGETVDLVRRHVRARGGTPAEGPLRRENMTPLPYDALLFDESTAAAVNELYAVDFDDFGYERVRPGTDSTARIRWDALCVERLPQLQALAERHERLHLVVEAFRGRLREKDQRIASLRSERKAARDRVAELRRRTARLQAENASLSATNRWMTGSLSWRVTRPLRAARRLAGRR